MGYRDRYSEDKQIWILDFTGIYVPDNLRTEFWKEVDKWDSSCPRSGSYAIGTLFRLLDQARETKYIH